MTVLVCLFCCFTSQVNSYGHGGVVSSPYHIFTWASLNKQLTSTSCTRGDQKVRGKVLLTCIAFVDCNENPQI